VSDLRGGSTEFILEGMRVEKSSLTVFTPLDDGTGVLLNLETRFYFSLNRTAVVVWREIENANSATTLDDLVRATCERFDIDHDAARREVSDFVERLEQLRMVRVD
jgi:Coenzyme PQQ synthesis protein D (PqqD)